MSITAVSAPVVLEPASQAFVVLNPLSDTHATRAAVAQAIAVLRQALHTV